MKKNLIVAWALVSVLSLFYVWSAPLDDTDDVVAGKRSGMILHVDHRTGCHYLSMGRFGGITPRLNPDGSQVCTR